MADMEAAERTIRLLNELLALDADAITELCEQRVECNKALAEHPTVQCGVIPHDQGGTLGSDGPKYRVGLLGILNGTCGAYGPEAGDKEGWGPITAEYDENNIVRFRMTKCVQCLNPSHDGICSCGGWGEAEQTEADRAIAEHEKEWEAGAEAREAAAKKSLDDTNAAMTKSTEELEEIW